MWNSTVSFLVQCDKEMNIIHTFWYEPVYLISPYQKKIQEIFLPEEELRMKEMFTEARSTNKPVSCAGSFKTLIGEEVSLCMMQMEDRMLIHGLRRDVFWSSVEKEELSIIIHRFMGVVRDSYGEINTKDELLIRQAFEEVQKLNNDLLNMKRELLKANAKLNEANEELSNRLVKDALTGLVSRYQYRDEILGMIRKNPEKEGIFAFIDLDDFKSINDTFGHRAGDEFLKAFAGRLMLLPFNQLICMRISGDEFGLYLHGYDKVEKTHQDHLWKSISEIVLAKPILIEEKEFPVSCSAGMSIYGRDTQDIYDLIEYADFAMYEVKKNGKKSYSSFKMDRYKEKKTVIL